MSVLAHTAQFARLGSTPYGYHPTQLVVVAQHMVGGPGLWLFTKLGDPDAPLVTISDTGPQSQLLMAGFLLAERDLSAAQGDPVLQELVEQLRLDSQDGDLHLDDAVAEQLAAFVRDMAMQVVISGLGRPLENVDVGAFGTWRVHVD